MAGPGARRSSRTTRRASIEEDGREYWVYEGVRGETMGLNAVVGRPAGQAQPGPDPLRGDARRLLRPGRSGPRTCSPTGSSASVLFPTLPRFAGTLFISFQRQGARRRLRPGLQRLRHRRVVPGRAARDVRADDHQPAVGSRRSPRPRSTGAPTRARGRCRSPRTRCRSGLPSYWDAHWDPVWRACEERDVVLCLHIGTSGTIPAADARGAGGAVVLRCSRSARCSRR